MFALLQLLARPLRVHEALTKERQATAHALAEKDAALNALFETGTAGISEVDLVTGRFVRVNRRFCEIMRREADLLLTLGPGDVIFPDDRARVKADWMSAMKIGGQWEQEVRHIAPDGSVFWGRLGVSVWKRSDAGAPVRCISVIQDISESVGVKERLQFSEELLRLGQQVGRIGSFNRDLRSGWIHCSAETSHIFGLPPGDGAFSSETWFAALVPEDRARVSTAIKESLKRRDAEIACEYRIRRHSNGSLRHLEMRARYLYDEAGSPARSVGVVIDVTERKEVEQQLSYAARHDALTGLANRSLLRECINVATERAQHGEFFAVHCLDLDRFKEVNDTLGHPQGDRLLVEVAARLRSELRVGDTLARLGGDEFAFIQSNLREPEDAGHLAHRIVERIAAPFTIGGQRVTIGVSVGVATAPQDGIHYDEIISAADLALYAAKAQPTRGWRYFEPQMQIQAQTRRDLERDLRRALEHGEFELFYQPILHITTLRIKRFEALIRWRRPGAGLVPPDTFIPIAEQIGLIVPLGAWVIARACAEATSWPASIGVAVNVSAVEVAAGNLDVTVAAALAESGLAQTV